MSSKYDEQVRAERALKLFTLEEFVVRQSVRWLIRDILQPRTIAVIFGPPKGGKTFSMTDLTMHSAHGLDWHGHAIPKPLRIAFLAGEGRNGLRVRLHAWLEHHDTAQLTGDFRLLPEALSLPDRATDVILALKEYQPDIVLVDTANAYFGPGDENSTMDMSRFVASLRLVRDELDCCVAVIHHTGLADTGRERGSNVLRAAADVVIQVAKDENDTGLVGFQVITGRDQEGWPNALPLRLRRVDTDWLDDDGNAITTCMVEGADSPVTLPGRGQKLTQAQRLTIEVVEQMARERANGSSTVVLPQTEIVAEVKRRGGNRTSPYRHFEQLAGRMRWKELAPSSLEVPVGAFGRRVSPVSPKGE